MKTRFLSLLIVSLFCVGCVEPQRFAVLENKVAAMEMENRRQEARQQNKKTEQLLKKDISAIQDRLNDSHIFSKEEYAALQYDIRQIKEELQRLEGAIQEMGHRLEEYSQNDLLEIETRMERLDNAISNNYEKLVKLERHMGFEPSAGKPVEKPVDPATGKTPMDIEQEAYAAAKQLFDDRDMENARIGFENFITTYPDSTNADNARFWVADSYYIEKRFAEAILEYQKVLEQYPDSNKLAAARLKQGYAFAELGEHANARLILRELLKKYPDSQEARYATEKLKNLK